MVSSSARRLLLADLPTEVLVEIASHLTASDAFLILRSTCSRFSFVSHLRFTVAHCKRKAPTPQNLPIPYAAACILLQERVYLSKTGWSDVKMARIFKLLLESECSFDPGAHDSFYVQQTALHGYAKSLRLLLSTSRVDPSADNFYAMAAACSGGFLDCMKLLSSAGFIGSSVSHNHLLNLCIEKGHFHIAKWLVVDLRSVDLRNGKLLKTAVCFGREEVVELLLTHYCENSIQGVGIFEDLENLATMLGHAKLAYMLRNRRTALALA
ncbi:hypothetical protein BJ741DRAFT_621156 [Chytriomyces cf. hyalinus JEL632]|nr:hypothetical protein BJ741DRAFT_621156 [Chytriomyces cf. hyalinus JEL632]